MVGENAKKGDLFLSYPPSGGLILRGVKKDGDCWSVQIVHSTGEIYSISTSVPFTPGNYCGWPTVKLVPEMEPEVIRLDQIWDYVSPKG